MTLWFLIIFLLLLFVIAVWLYNRLVRQRNIVAEAWAGIDVQLTRRADLIPNLVEMVKGYQTYEASVLEDVTRARGDAADHPETRARRENRLTDHIVKLFALAEAYPDLKASDTFRDLHESLVEVEDQLQYARRYYNGAVRDLNNRVESFPDMLIAQPFGFSSAEFFEIQFASQRQSPKVEL